jgi:hypothetical protein
MVTSLKIQTLRIGPEGHRPVHEVGWRHPIDAPPFA